MRGSRAGSRSRKSYLSDIGRKTGKFRAANRAVRSQPSLHLWGRGAAAGSLLCVRQGQGLSPARQVAVKVARFRLRDNAFAQTSAHLRYIVRDGVSREGALPSLYDGQDDHADPQKFASNCRDEPGHFAIVVSPEDGDQLADLKPYIRRLMTQIEKDLGTSLEWIAADHFDTGTPHTHILLRGSDEEGKSLLIARDYISHGLRERAGELMSAELGPELAGDQVRKLRRETRLEKVTDVDVRLAAESIGGGPVVSIHDDPFEQAQRTRRLRFLEQLGLAQPDGVLIWLVDPDLLSRLTAIDRQVERLATLRLAAANVGLEQGRGGHRLSDPGRIPRHGLIGALIEDARPIPSVAKITLMIDGADGQLHSVEIASEQTDMPLKAGTILRVPAAAPLTGDQRDTANAQPSISQQPPKIEILSALPLPQMTEYDGPTWLDQTLFSEEPILARDAGFGRDLRTAQWQRQRWLMEQGLLNSGSLEQERADRDSLQHADGKPAIYARLLPALRQREFLRMAGQLSEELGLEFVQHEPGSLVGGTVRRHVDLSHGKFAVVEDGYQFRLVPWDVARKAISETGLTFAPHAIDSIDGPGGRGRGGPGIS